MFEEVIRPRFSETNAAGHIGFTVLPAWYEQALEGIYRIFSPQLDPKLWELILVKFEMECVAEINHREEVSIRTRVKKIGNASLTVVQELHQGGSRKATAESVLVNFDYAAHASRPIDAPIRRALEAHLAT